MAITISNYRITPYTQKDALPKVIFGGSWGIDISITDHLENDEYILALDYERLVYPLDHAVCALTNTFAISNNVLSMSVNLESSRLAKWISTLKKPTPIYVQLVRVRESASEVVYSTLLLDEILALPSIIDGDAYQDENTPIGDLLATKLDKPIEEGEDGQVLTLENGVNVWKDAGEGTQKQADWNESNIDSPSYIKNKPSIPSKLAQLSDDSTHRIVTDSEKSTWNSKSDFSGSYNDLTDKPTIPTVYNPTITFKQGNSTKGIITLNQSGNETITFDEGGGGSEQVQADWNVNDSSSKAYIKNKPTIPTALSDLSQNSSYRTVTDSEKSTWNSKSDFSGSYNDLTNKPTIPTVYNSTITFTQGGNTKGTITLNQSSNETIALDAGGGGGSWDGTFPEVITSAATLTAEPAHSYYWEVGAQDATLSASTTSNVDYDVPIDISISGGTVTVSGVTRIGLLVDGCINRCVITRRYDDAILYVYAYEVLS